MNKNDTEESNSAKSNSIEAILGVMAGEKSVSEAATDYALSVEEIELGRQMFVAGYRNHAKGEFHFRKDTTRVKRVVASILITFTLTLIVSGIVFAETSNCSPKFPFCFSSNTAAKASEVNANFTKILAWLEGKTGQVEDLKNINNEGSIHSTGTISADGSMSSSSFTSGEVVIDKLLVKSNIITQDLKVDGVLSTGCKWQECRGEDWVDCKCDPELFLQSGGCDATTEPNIFSHNMYTGDNTWTCGGHGTNKTVRILCCRQK